ncbi:hypothetical protein [Singulisphaera sp. PoT]|uniref:hypothetical protein n=1 Tax=Singulisphaera sp. PoT TaxID=3411797 RepID=UPI003BF5B3B7
MIVTKIREIRTGRESVQGKDWKRTYKRTFKVETDDPYVGGKTVRESLPLAIGMPYQFGAEVDMGAWVTNISATCDMDDGKQWTCVVDYGPYDANQQPQDPTQWVPNISWGNAAFQKIIEKDKDDNEVKNSAGVPFNPALQADDSRSVLSITWNMKHFEDTWSDTYKDKINQSTFWGRAPKTVKCTPINGVRKYNPDYGWYWEVSFEFHVKEETWVFKPLDAGMYKIKDDGTDIEAITKNGVPITEPVPLDGSGKPMPKDGTPTYLEIEYYKEIDFGVFGLDGFYQALQSYVPPIPGGGT